MQRRSDGHQPLALFQPVEFRPWKSRDAVRSAPDRPGHGANRINVTTARRDELLQLEESAIQKSQPHIYGGHARLACSDSKTEPTGDLSGCRVIA
jgi:hypothetical protein